MADKRNEFQELVFFIIMFGAMILWGGSWVSGKVLTLSAPPFVLVFWRFFTAFVSCAVILRVLGLGICINRRGILLVCLGGLLLGVYNYFFFAGLRTGFAGAGGVVVTTLNPLCTFIFGLMIYKKRITLMDGAGLAAGLTGGLILLQVWHLDAELIQQSGNLYFLAAAGLWGGLTIITQMSRQEMHPLVFSFYIYGVSSAISLAVSGGDIFLPAVRQTGFILNICYLSVGATTFATTAYFFAAGRVGAQRASSFTFLVPGSALLLSWLFLGEIPAVSTLAGGILALAAVYMLNRPEKKITAE